LYFRKSASLIFQTFFGKRGACISKRGAYIFECFVRHDAHSDVATTVQKQELDSKGTREESKAAPKQKYTYFQRFASYYKAKIHVF
jgi:hypothetical protein